MFIGIDIGGTKIAAGLLDFERSPTPLARVTKSTTASDPGQIITDVIGLIRHLLEQSRDVPGAPNPGDAVRAVGIGAPGIIDCNAREIVAASDILQGWAGANLVGRLEQAVDLPVFIDNDVRAMARAEASLGNARESPLCLHVSLGTGVGGAISSQDSQGVHTVNPGATGSLGDIAHLVSPEKGAIRCGCGHDQHLEAVASGPAISAEYTKRCGDVVTLEEVAERLQANDHIARDVVVRAATLAGEVLAGVVSAFDIDSILLAGGATKVSPVLTRTLTTTIASSVWPRDRHVDVKRAFFGDDAAIIGAALVAREQVPAGSF